jgi:glycine/D-amino acid oxidase-like deaminating enzyme
MEEVDYLIVGQGISGTLLSRNLQQGGKKVVVIDEHAPATASSVAGGLINPVTGKRLVKSWMIEQFFPFAWDTYQAIEKELNLALIRKMSIHEFHATQGSRDIFVNRMHEDGAYLSDAQDDWQQYFRYNYGVHQIAPCMLLNVSSLLAGWRSHLLQDGSLLEERFTEEALVVNKDDVVYKKIKARKLIFCDGIASADSNYFNRLPWSKDKGEALIVQISGLPSTAIFRQAGISILPLKNGLFWVGASHDWKFTHMNPSVSYRAKVEELLDYWLKLPYRIVDHVVALRPSNIERRPFVGFHPLYHNIGILNGMGSKGLSMAPYFAHQLARHLIDGTHLLPEVEVKRYQRILAK